MAVSTRHTSGLQPSELIINAGQPSMGKTAFAMNIAENARSKDGKTWPYFLLKWPKRHYLQRMLCSRAPSRFSPNADRHVVALKIRQRFLLRWNNWYGRSSYIDEDREGSHSAAPSEVAALAANDWEAGPRNRRLSATDVARS